MAIYPRSFGFAGPEGAAFDVANQNAIINLMRPVVTNASLGYGPQGIGAFRPQRTQVDVFGQGRGYLNPSTGIVEGVNAAGQQFRVQPAGTEEARQLAEDRALKRQMMQAQLKEAELANQQKEAAMAGPSIDYTFNADLGGYVPKTPGGQFIPLQGIGGRPGAKLTEAQAKATTFASQMAAASNELDKLEGKGFDLTKPSTQFETRMAGGFGNIFTSPESQQAKQSQNQWSEAFLRVKTGAAATKEEVDLNNKTFFPQVGDSKEVIDQKRRMRTQAEQDVLNMTGSGREMATKRESQSQASSQMPKTGEVRGGYMFLGGDPADPNRWKQQ